MIVAFAKVIGLRRVPTFSRVASMGIRATVAAPPAPAPTQPAPPPAENGIIAIPDVSGKRDLVCDISPNVGWQVELP